MRQKLRTEFSIILPSGYWRSVKFSWNFDTVTNLQFVRCGISINFWGKNWRDFDNWIDGPINFARVVMCVWKSFRLLNEDGKVVGGKSFFAFEGKQNGFEEVTTNKVYGV